MREVSITMSPERQREVHELIRREFVRMGGQGTLRELARRVMPLFSDEERAGLIMEGMLALQHDRAAPDDADDES